MTSITITLGGQVEAFVKRFAQERGLSPAEATLELIQRSAQVEEMSPLRERLGPYFEAADVRDEEDVQRLVDEVRDNPSGA